MIGRAAGWVLLFALAVSSVRAQTPAEPTPTQAPSAPAIEEAPELPEEQRPKLNLQLEPKTPVAVGDLVKLTIYADAVQGDDVTVPEQSFAPFEVHKKNARVEPAKDGRQRFVFQLELLAFEPVKGTLPAVELRVVTKAGVVGTVKTPQLPVEVKSLIENEPNAKLKPESAPVPVLQDDFTLLYVAGALLAAGLIALATLLVSRWLQRRQKPLPPPPPPRPPWEIAVEKLAELRRRKQRMVEEGKAAQFVAEVSDVVREYLGGRFGFDGLETTTHEMLELLRQRNCNPGLWQEVGAYLRRCDLVKFAKVEPDQDEADLVFAKAQDIVQFSMPLGDTYDPRPQGPGPGTPIAPAGGGATGEPPASGRPS